MPRRSPTRQELPFELDPEPAQEILTGMGGLPLIVKAFRELGLPSSIEHHIRIKQRQRGFDESTFVESFVILNAMGGDCLDDFDRLREDAGLEYLIGHAVPSPEAARKFLYEFHDEERIEEGRQQLRLNQTAFVPDESRTLRGLAQVNRDLVLQVGQRCAQQRIATVDQDTTIIESQKREAKSTYEGQRGYQPMLAVWAETDIILADEFRDGNVPGMLDPLRVAQAAFDALPSTVTEYYYRADSAFHENRLLEWLDNPNRPNGPEGFIGFAISARMSPRLRAAMEAIPEANWQPCPGYTAEDAVQECADMDYVPWQPNEHRHSQPLRYVGIRIRKKQGDLFVDGSAVKHFAIVSNLKDWTLPRLIQWQREKAGSIERIHDVLKNDLAAGVLPCGRFGANAAWLRLAILTHNLLTALKRIGLPAEYLTARPKRLRFLLLNIPGRLFFHARQIRLRLSTFTDRIAHWLEAFAVLAQPVT